MCNVERTLTSNNVASPCDLRNMFQVESCTVCNREQFAGPGFKSTQHSYLLAEVLPAILAVVGDEDELFSQVAQSCYGFTNTLNTEVHKETGELT